MESGVSDYVPHIAAMLVGGLATSLGLTWLARKPHARRLLLATRGWMLALATAVAVAGGGGAVYWLARSFLASVGLEPAMPSPGGLLLFGVLVGLPLALPGVVMAWSDARTRRAAELRRRDFVPTKDDRRGFARDLAKQIAELSQPPREVTVSIGGEGGRVLELVGDLGAAEGKRLVDALRSDLDELGFKRVEGSGAGASWWERV